MDPFGAEGCALHFAFEAGPFAIVFRVITDSDAPIKPMICQLIVGNARKVRFGYVGGGYGLRLPFFVDDFDSTGTDVAADIRLGIFCDVIDGNAIADGWLPKFAFLGASPWLVALFGPFIRFFTRHPDLFSKSATLFLNRFMADPVLEGMPSLIEFIAGQVRLAGGEFHKLLQNPRADDLTGVLLFLLDALIKNPDRRDLEDPEASADGADGPAPPEKRGQDLKSLPRRLWPNKPPKAPNFPWAFRSKTKFTSPSIDLLLGITDDGGLRVLPPPMVEGVRCNWLVYVNLT